MLQPSQEQAALTAFLPQAQLSPAGDADLLAHAENASVQMAIKNTLRIIIDFPLFVFHDVESYGTVPPSFSVVRSVCARVSCTMMPFYVCSAGLSFNVA